MYINKFDKIPQFRTTDASRLEASLGSRLYAAHCQVGRAISIGRGEQGYPSKASFELHIASTGEMHLADRTIEVLKILRKWEKRVEGEYYKIAEAVCYQNKSMRWCARRYQKSRRTIGKILRLSLEEWCLLSCTGLVAKSIPKPKPGFKGEFKATKIVIFSEDSAQ